MHKFTLLGKKFGMKIKCCISYTTEPAGNGVGPALEAIDVLKVLEQKKDRSLALEKRSLDLAGTLLSLCYESKHIKKDGRKEAQTILSSKKAFLKFQEIVTAQGGSLEIDSTKLQMVGVRKDILAQTSGTIHSIQNRHLNTIAKILGAPHNKYAGIYIHSKINDIVSKNQPLLTFYAKNQYLITEALDTLKSFPILQITH